MSKQQLIEAIRTLNPSAATDFLGHFNEQNLQRYLHHLRYTTRPRGAASIWVRPSETPAIVTRSH